MSGSWSPSFLWSTCYLLNVKVVVFLIHDARGSVILVRLALSSRHTEDCSTGTLASSGVMISGPGTLGRKSLLPKSKVYSHLPSQQ